MLGFGGVNTIAYTRVTHLFIQMSPPVCLFQAIRRSANYIIQVSCAQLKEFRDKCTLTLEIHANIRLQDSPYRSPKHHNTLLKEYVRVLFMNHFRHVHVDIYVSIHSNAECPSKPLHLILEGELSILTGYNTNTTSSTLRITP